MNRRNSIVAGAVLSAALLVTSLTWGALVLFPHRVHVDSGISCPDCHTTVEESAQSGDNNLPRLNVCKDCHDPVPELKLRASLERELIFSHKVHLGKAVACSTCHSMAGEDAGARIQLPDMELCLACHMERGETQECEACHTKLGSPELIPKSHTRQWVFAHGEGARQDEGYCANCHQQSFCQECHQGDNLEPKPHRRNWVYTHSINARQGTLDCSDCHDAATESDCVACHKSPAGRPGSHRRGRWLERHGSEAEKNLAACATCHFDMGGDSYCMQCHDD